MDLIIPLEPFLLATELAIIELGENATAVERMLSIVAVVNFILTGGI
jgi:hypothetical protein